MIKAEGEGPAEICIPAGGDGRRGTEALAPTAPLNVGVRTGGGHRLEFIAVPGHTQSDIAVFDHTTGVLFAIDQVSNQRTPPAQCRSGAMAAIAGAAGRRAVQVLVPAMAR